MAEIVQRSDQTALFAGPGLEWLDVAFTSPNAFAAAAAAAIQVDVQLKGSNSQQNVPKTIMLEVLSLKNENPLSTVASAHAAFSSLVVVTNGFILKVTTAGSRILVATDVTGLVSISATNGASTLRIGVRTPDGVLHISPTLTWT